MPPRLTKVALGLCVALFLAGVALIFFGHGVIGTLCLLAAGIGFGIWGPPAEGGSNIHGASDST